jgi:hypothetical protein
MVDDNTLRLYRSSDPYRRAAEPSRPSEEASARDPLAELARLFGQSDPFTDFGRSHSRQGQQEAHAAPADWQGAPAPEPQCAAADAQRGWGQGSSHASSRASSHAASWDYTHSPTLQPEGRRSDSRSHSELHLGADQQARHYDDNRTDDGQHNALAAEYSLNPYDDAMYDHAPRVRRGGGFATALALIGCAVLSIAGAHAHRSYYGNPNSTQPPPVADNSTPTKIVPASPGDPQSVNVAQDRSANPDKEQIVSKLEEPVALEDLGTQAAPPVTLPASVAPGQGASTSTEPKKIRTVVIRPDASDMSGKPVSSQPAAAPGPAAVPAALTPAAAPPAPAGAAPEMTESEVSGFVVQLSSQKSEAKAQSSFRSLQAKFPNELSGLQPIIRRTDLGSKRGFYRTLVGPFESAQEARQFCAKYKAARGQCLVRNI